MDSATGSPTGSAATGSATGSTTGSATGWATGSATGSVTSLVLAFALALDLSAGDCLSASDAGGAGGDGGFSSSKNSIGLTETFITLLALYSLGLRFGLEIICGASCCSSSGTLAMVVARCQNHSLYYLVNENCKCLCIRNLFLKSKYKGQTNVVLLQIGDVATMALELEVIDEERLVGAIQIIHT